MHQPRPSAEYMSLCRSRLTLSKRINIPSVLHPIRSPLHSQKLQSTATSYRQGYFRMPRYVQSPPAVSDRIHDAMDLALPLFCLPVVSSSHGHSVDAKRNASGLKTQSTPYPA